MAGIALIVIGILCLFLSDTVAATGTWWQGTLDAFGVGFVVGGLVDVLVISGLEQAQRRRENNVEASRILRAHHEHPCDTSIAQDARDHLTQSGRQINPLLRRRLSDLSADLATYEREGTRPGQADAVTNPETPEPGLWCGAA